MPSQFLINVRKIGRQYVLFNHDEIAGGRLFKGETAAAKGRKAVLWPFKEPEGVWNRHATKASAEAATAKLSTYLEAREKVLNH